MSELAESEKTRIRAALRQDPELLAAVREAAERFDGRVVGLRQEQTGALPGDQETLRS